jgi:hypothetical protein
MRAGAGKWIPAVAASAHERALSVGIRKWFNWYVLSVILARISLFAADFIPALSQPLLALANLKWAFFFHAHLRFIRAPGWKTALLGWRFHF